jgi:hypothetical protein
MPCIVEADVATGVVVVRAEGSLSVEEVRGAILEIWRTPEYQAQLRVLWDLREGAVADFSAADLQEIASFNDEKRPELPRSRVAVLVDREVDYGVMRMLGAFLPGQKVENQVFREEAAAWRWLAE